MNVCTHVYMYCIPLPKSIKTDPIIDNTNSNTNTTLPWKYQIEDHE